MNENRRPSEGWGLRTGSLGGSPWDPSLRWGDGLWGPS
jgi:hypothetical protein